LISNSVDGLRNDKNEQNLCQAHPSVCLLAGNWKRKGLEAVKTETGAEFFFKAAALQVTKTTAPAGTTEFK
jgi:hypothetical protein